MASGKVKKWFPDRGTGWIIDQEDGADVFFGDRALSGLNVTEIHIGLEVDFDRIVQERGPAARNVRRPGTGLPHRAGSPLGRAIRSAGERGARSSPEDIPVPPTEVPSPRSLQAILASDLVPQHQRHPGLVLDKFLDPCPDQKEQKTALGRICKIPGDREWLDRLLLRRRSVLGVLRADVWSRRTAGSMTLHLARASALENAGLCLHPIYGFTYLPGTGLKGLARAYAETVWLAAQPPENQGDSWKTIERVFGWAPGSDQVAPGKSKPWKPGDPGLDHSEDDAANTGVIVFHDAWPEKWPSLLVDIVNNHHSAYYQSQEDSPPGDWDSPIPVYFLAVHAGQTFSFGLSKRRWASDEDDESLTLAREWLDGALTHLGVGAKTAAGYGRFEEPLETSPTKEVVRSTWAGVLGAPSGSAGIPRREWSATLSLVTPAFLAGADQESSRDCDLRPATLRGLLRWWWRTLHAGYLEIRELRKLEAALWGDTEQGGAIHIELRPERSPQAILFNHRDPRSRFRPEERFKSQHHLEDPPRKTTQGLFYVAYGMDEKSRDEVKQRYYLDAGWNWSLSLVARAGVPPAGASSPGPIPAEQILNQALGALTLLCTHGGVGSKARKGFGSLQVEDGRLPELSLAELRDSAAKFRRVLGWDRRFDEARLRSPALAIAIPMEPAVRTPWVDPWQALDRIGFAYQAFMQKKNHQRAKVSMGLPRKIHGPNEDGPIQNKKTGVYFQDPETWSPPEWLDFADRTENVEPKDARYASPVHLHLSRGPDAHLTVHALAFPAHNLPDLVSSTRFLHEFLQAFRDDLEGRASRSGSRPPGSAPGPGATPPRPGLLFVIVISRPVEAGIPDHRQCHRAGPSR